MMGIKRSEFLSLSVRRAWIEITKTVALEDPESVALRKESVDRNTSKDKNTMQVPVALRKESVDRNAEKPSISATSETVALRKESVDRNYGDDLTFSDGVVALRKESVDRNFVSAFDVLAISVVALRKESVDRNKYVVQCRKVMGGRSP